MAINSTEKEISKRHRQDIFRFFEQEPYAQFLGIKLLEIGEGTACAELDVKDHMLNTHGTVHGAILFALADYVFAAACNSYGKTAVGLSTTVNFMSPGRNGSCIKASAVEEKKTTVLPGIKLELKAMGSYWLRWKHWLIVRRIILFQLKTLPLMNNKQK